MQNDKPFSLFLYPVAIPKIYLKLDKLGTKSKVSRYEKCYNLSTNCLIDLKIHTKLFLYVTKVHVKFQAIPTIPSGSSRLITFIEISKFMGCL